MWIRAGGAAGYSTRRRVRGLPRAAVHPLIARFPHRFFSGVTCGRCFKLCCNRPVSVTPPPPPFFHSSPPPLCLSVCATVHPFCSTVRRHCCLTDEFQSCNPLQKLSCVEIDAALSLPLPTSLPSVAANRMSIIIKTFSSSLWE